VSDKRRSVGDAGHVQEELPVELQMDLLVDGELTESQRRVLLRRMEELGSHAAVGWRELALRFLERQAEKETVGKLMAGGRIVPVEFVEPIHKPTTWRRLLSPVPLGMAAGLMTAVTSALVTLYVMGGNGAARGTAIEFEALLPSEALGGAEGIAVRLPLVTQRNPDGGLPMLPFSSEESYGIRQRSLVIQPGVDGRPVAYPVNTMMMQVH
jgi:hypothetical protein